MACPSCTSLEEVSFTANVLAPLFLNEPNAKCVQDILSAFGASEVSCVINEWPFFDENDRAFAQPSFGKLAQGALQANSIEALYEYRRLFIGPEPMPCPPWGSVYTDEDCVIFGTSTLDLRMWMRSNGIQSNSAESSPDDHIGLLLYLMGYLAREKPECLDEFLENHLLTWAGHYLVQLKASSKHPIYQGLAEVTYSTLAALRKYFNLAVKTPKFYRY